LLYNKKGPPHHGSVMFLKEAYEKVGGYRYQFYYGQDSDLWLRFGMIGLIGYVPEFLYEFKLDYSDISFLKNSIQNEFGKLGQTCHKARLGGNSEEAYLTQALQLQLKIKNKIRQSKQYKFDYFIGSCLLKRKDQRALSYFWKAFVNRPFHAALFLKILSALFLFIFQKLICHKNKNYS